MSERGKLVVISGPSAGVGKDTLLGMFLEAHPEWENPVSTTTRQPRQGEVDGVDYNFVDRATFEQWNQEGRFLEQFEVAGNLYGTLREPTEELLEKGKDVIFRKDVLGALAIKNMLPEAIIIFIMAESIGKLEERIRARATDDEETIRKRLKLAEEEMVYKDQFDHVIVNPTGHPEEALAEIEKAVGA